MPLSPSSDVVVVGGGVIGLASAWECRRRGLPVTVVDDAPARAASRAAAGMLAPVTEAHFGEQPLLALNMESARRWPAFAQALEDATGQASGYRQCGTLAVARDLDDRRELDRLHDFQVDLGLVVQRLGSQEVRELEPGLAPSVRGGLLVEGDHQVDNRRLVRTLRAACEQAGVEFVARRVTSLDTTGQRVDGVMLAGGDHMSAGRVVLAAGAWSGLIDGLPSASLQVRPVKGQLLHLHGPADPGLLGRSVRGLDVYLVPRGDGRLVVGATVEERGFDPTVTAGAVLDLLTAAFELVPGVTELVLTETVSGLRPGTPDNAPLIGDGPLERLVVATGHYRNGILLAPVTADAVAARITDGGWPDTVRAFDPGRFAAVTRGDSARRGGGT